MAVHEALLNLLEARWRSYQQPPVPMSPDVASYVVLCTTGDSEAGFGSMDEADTKARFCELHPPRPEGADGAGAARVRALLVADQGEAVLIGLYLGMRTRGLDAAAACAKVRRIGHEKISVAVRERALLAFEVWHREAFGPPGKESE